MGVPGNRHSYRDLDHENSGEVFELREPGGYYSGIFQEDSIMILTDRIELNPRICNGRPVIKGTRIPVSVILEQIAAGESWDVLLVGYPELKKEDIQAALLYARSSLDHTEVRAAYG